MGEGVGPELSAAVYQCASEAHRTAVPAGSNRYGPVPEARSVEVAVGNPDGYRWRIHEVHCEAVAARHPNSSKGAWTGGDLGPQIYGEQAVTIWRIGSYQCVGTDPGTRAPRFGSAENPASRLVAEP